MARPPTRPAAIRMGAVGARIVRGPTGPRWYWRVTLRSGAKERNLRAGWWTAAEAEEQVRAAVCELEASGAAEVAPVRGERHATRGAAPCRARGRAVDPWDDDDDDEDDDAELEAMLEELEAELHVAKLPMGASLQVDEIRTLRDLMELWVGAMEQDSDIAPTTLKLRVHAAHHLCRLLGHLAPADVRPRVLGWYRETRLAMPRRRPGAKDGRPSQELTAPSSVRNEIRFLGQAIRWAQVEELLPPGPVPKVPVRVRGSVYNRATPTADEIKAVLEAMDDDWSYVAALLYATTGARLGEIATLTWGNIDLQRGVLRVSGKTGPRNVPILPVLRQALARTWERLQKRGAKHVTPNARVLDCAVETARRVGMRLETACKRAGVKPFPPGGFRRAAVNMLYRTAFGPSVAASVLGHSPAVALKHYCQVDIEDARAALEATTLANRLALPTPAHAGAHGGGNARDGGVHGSREGAEQVQLRRRWQVPEAPHRAQRVQDDALRALPRHALLGVDVRRDQQAEVGDQVPHLATLGAHGLLEVREAVHDTFGGRGSARQAWLHPGVDVGIELAEAVEDGDVPEGVGVEDERALQSVAHLAGGYAREGVGLELGRGGNRDARGKVHVPLTQGQFEAALPEHRGEAGAWGGGSVHASPRKGRPPVRPLVRAFK